MKILISLLAGSLFMSLVMVAARIFSVFTGQKVSARTRYMMWIILLLGAIIPFRPVIGSGLITLPGTLIEKASSSSDDEIYINTTVEMPKEDVSTPNSPQESALAKKGFQMPSTVQIIVFLWAAGAIFFFGKYMLEYAKFYRLVKRWGKPVSDPDTLQIYRIVREKMGLGQKDVGLIRCNFISTPMLTGLLRPAILLPKDEIEKEEMSLILEHELTHYLHKDLWVNLLSIIVICIHWFNPLVYLCLPTIYGDGESYCDETVLKNRDTDYRRFYGEVIISIIQHSSNKPIALSTCFYEKKINIKRRLYNIMEKNKNRKVISIAAIAGVLALTIISGSVLVFANQSKSEAVSLDTAKQIALRNAKINAKEASFIKAKQEFSDEKQVYDIEFYANGVEYDYEIDVKTGRILDVDRDIENFTIPTANTPTPTENDIGLEKAKEIALQHAGFNTKEVFFVQAKKDFEDGREVYDIEFYVNNVEYDYEIDVKTGKILDVDQDIENFTIPAPKTPAAANGISIEKAKQIALQHAKLSESAVSFLKAELDTEKGKKYYDIEFKYNGLEYDYEIDPTSGEILSYDVERENDD